MIRLSQLQGRVVKISLSDWQIDLYVLFQNQRIQLRPNYSGEVDTVMEGTMRGLFSVSLARASGSSLFEQGIKISGDTELGEKIRDIFQQVNLDWEDFLSRYLGDTVSHQIMWRVKRALGIGQKTFRNLEEHIRDYCIMKWQYLPSRAQVETFYHDIAVLRNDVDRVEARLNRLEKI